MSSSISAPNTNAIGKRARKVRTPNWRTAVAAAKPTKPIMPTMPTTLALRKAAAANAAKRMVFTGMPSAAAWVSLRLIIASGFTNIAISAAAAAMRHKSCKLSCQLSCSSEPAPQSMMPRVSSE